MPAPTSTRTAIPPYPRDDAHPLAGLRLTPDTRAVIEERRRRWGPYLTGAADPQAPLATRFVPALLALGGRTGPLDDEIAWPATLYPAGFRHQVRQHCGLPPDASGPAAVRRLDGEQDRLRLALILNSLSLYRTTVDLLGRHARSPEQNPHLVYEVARAAYQVGGTAPALQVFVALCAARRPSRAIRLNAASRLIAHYARSGHDLDACGYWVDRALALIPDENSAEPADLATGLAVSRVHRASALHASRRRDAAGVSRALLAADAADTAIAPLARGELGRLEQEQNERLILEAALKAFVGTGGRVDPLGAAGAADRLQHLDPWDPYTRLTIGDARWMLQDDQAALASYDVAVRMGTLAGAQAAHRGAEVLARTGRPGPAAQWLARAVELDPAATAVELSGD